ncbi:unnamed protein product [Closterium sp. NIES-53]
MASARVAVVLLLVACALQSAAGRGRFFPSRYYATGPRGEPIPPRPPRRHNSQHRTSHQLRPTIVHQHHLRAASIPDLPPPPSPPSATTPPIQVVRFARRRLPRPETRRARNSRARMLVTSRAPKLVRRPGHQARLGGGHRFRPRELLVTDSDGGTFEFDRGTGQTMKFFDGTDRNGDEVEILEEVPRAASSGGGGPAYDSMQRLGRPHHGRHGRRSPRQHSVVRYSNPMLDSIAEQNEEMGGPPGGILAGYTDSGSGEESAGGDWPMLDAIDEQNGRMGGSEYSSDGGSERGWNDGLEGGSEGEWDDGSTGGWEDGSDVSSGSNWYDGSDALSDDGSGGVWDDGSGGGWDVGSGGGSEDAWDDGSDGGWDDNSEGGWDDGTGNDGSSDNSTWEGDYGSNQGLGFSGGDNSYFPDAYGAEPNDAEDSLYPTGGDYYTADIADSTAALKPMVPRTAATRRPPRAVARPTPVPPNRATRAKPVKRQAGARGPASQAKPVKRPGNYHGGSAHATPGHHNGKPRPSAHVAANQHAGTARAKPVRAKPAQAVGTGAGTETGCGGSVWERRWEFQQLWWRGDCHSRWQQRWQWWQWQQWWHW